jgi:hypothetical protein
MATNVNQELLMAARKRAEGSVADMPDGPLKIAAFQTILTQLLQKELNQFGVASSPTSSTRSQAKKKGPILSGGTTSRLLGLLEEGIFVRQRSLAEIRQILSERGWHYQPEDLGTPVTRLVRRRQLRRSQVTEGGKKLWKYSNY